MQLFGTGKVKPSEWFKKPDIEQTTPVEKDEIGGEAVITDKTANGGISLMSTALAPELFAENGVSAAAETAYTITATVSPLESTVTNFSWSTAWKNAASDWANGKSVSDYVTINTSSNNLSATVACLQAFGEPITITIKYDYNDDISASCQVDYIKRLENVKATENNFENNEYESGAVYIPTISTSYGVGTLDGTITYSNFYLELSDEALNYLQNNYFYRIGFQKFDDEGYSYGLQQKSKITVDLKDGNDGFTAKYWSYQEVMENEEVYYHTDFLEMSDYACLASSGSGNYAKFIEYYNAAFHNLIDATSNQIRLAVDYEYTYTTVNGLQTYNGTAYSDYTSILKDSIPSSSYLSVNGVSVNNGSLVF